MTQKGALFKGQKKKAQVASNHGKDIKIRKGKTFKPPKKKSGDFLAGKDISKFINQANESKAAAMAAKEGAQLRLVKPPPAAAAAAAKAGGARAKGGPPKAPKR